MKFIGTFGVFTIFVVFALFNGAESQTCPPGPPQPLPAYCTLDYCNELLRCKLEKEIAKSVSSLKCTDTEGQFCSVDKMCYKKQDAKSFTAANGECTTAKGMLVGSTIHPNVVKNCLKEVGPFWVAGTAAGTMCPQGTATLATGAVTPSMANCTDTEISFCKLTVP